jgi:hypothetical protein
MCSRAAGNFTPGPRYNPRHGRLADWSGAPPFLSSRASSYGPTRTERSASIIGALSISGPVAAVRLRPGPDHCDTDKAYVLTISQRFGAQESRELWRRNETRPAPTRADHRTRGGMTLQLRAPNSRPPLFRATAVVRRPTAGATAPLTTLEIGALRSIVSVV